MEQNHIAHINEYTGAVQSIREHSERTADLCREYAVPPMKDLAYAIGLFHDLGKYQPSFAKRLLGGHIRVEHAVCGALEVHKAYPSPLNLMMEYCIVGHHTGLPNGGNKNDSPDQSTLQGRMSRPFEPYDHFKKEITLPKIDYSSYLRFLSADCNKDPDKLIDKFAFLTRYVFSCLVDADWTDTAEFCREGLPPAPLGGDFEACLRKVDDHLRSFVCVTELQKKRTLLQEQAYKNARREGEIYLLNMPTGSGKTLASVKIALEKAVRTGKKRVIYVIPFNSIIEQTANVFEDIFGEDMEILRHHSTYSYEDEANGSEDYRLSAKTAAENWDAPFIITTGVQFFESLYSNKKGKLRKLHNMSESILVFDEAHLMPEAYLQSCLQAAAYLTRYLNSQAIFLTATMPDYERLLKIYALENSKIINLINDTSFFREFKKCAYHYIGKRTKEQLLLSLGKAPSTLIIVNKKATARALYKECVGEKYHLSTYMTSKDRSRVLKEIIRALADLEKDYPNLQKVPQDRHITIVSTSLIEAGVDLDVHTVFRELNGLDSILQAGGRCNREGKRKQADVFIFQLSEETDRVDMERKHNLTKGLLERQGDITQPECIREYYDRMYFMEKEEIEKNTIHQFCRDLHSIPFQTYGENFKVIEDRSCSIVVPTDEDSRRMVEQLRYTKKGDARKLQKYTCSVAHWELDALLRQNVIRDFDTGIFCLLNEDYYDHNLGILFEAKDYIL